MGGRLDHRRTVPARFVHVRDGVQRDGNRERSFQLGQDGVRSAIRRFLEDALELPPDREYDIIVRPNENRETVLGLHLDSRCVVCTQHDAE